MIDTLSWQATHACVLCSVCPLPIMIVRRTLVVPLVGWSSATPRSLPLLSHAAAATALHGVARAVPDGVFAPAHHAPQSRMRSAA